jgi:hypothetical protein
MKITESHLRRLIRSRLIERLERDEEEEREGADGEGGSGEDSSDRPAPGSVGETSGTATVDTLSPSAKSKFEDFIEAASDAGYSIKINSTWRAPSHQWNLKYTDRGALTPATPCRSDHQYGYAMDINFSYTDSNGRDVSVNSRSPDRMWRPLVDIAEPMGIRWQGAKDRVHFYVSDVPSSRKERCTQFYAEELGSDPQAWGSEAMKEMEAENAAEIARILDVPVSAFEETHEDAEDELA